MATSAERRAAKEGFALWESPGFLVWQISMRWQREVAAALKPLGLTHVQFALMASVCALSTEGGSPNQREVAERAGTDVMMTSQILRSLEDRDLLERHTDSADSRVRRVRLSAAGRRVLTKAMSAVEAVDQALFTGASSATALEFIQRTGLISRGTGAGQG